ncbi:MAG: rRNA maturation RNase YbeY [Actinomycetota bacterium]|nr:rRNA maturation RNase YbeY [Actinomycetota bacterium]
MAVFVADEQDRPVDADDLASLAGHVLRERRVPPDMELSLLLVDEEAITALNAHHMGKSEPTDVLAFPIDEPGETPPGVPAVLGDVVLCPVVAERQAVGSGHEVREELRILVIHGILHVLGMDHAVPDDEREMFALTERLLDSFRRLRSEGDLGDRVDQGGEGTQ